MANFQTHLNVGILVSAAATLSLHVAGFSTQSQLPTLFVLGVAGSLLPDIDLERSKPTGLLFNVLGVALAFAITLPLTGRFVPQALIALWTLVFLATRYGVLKVFSSLTVHRGVWHSWLAIATVTLATTDLAYWVWEHTPERAWIAGFMVGIGYLTHLVLDELYSVDLFNARIKRSFGTALKPISLKYPWSTITMAAALVALISVAPPITELLQQLHLDPRATLAEWEATLHQGAHWIGGYLKDGLNRLSVDSR